ncbi:MAG: hypothetical protein PHI72_06250 [Atribacterota bacterium]|nr:hypothetical protein [Atribacterota bacterium]MDD4896982.1 hypothetical protein [Atribacterota bacterium]MDD5636698.1 hypothetical protein [Atribacterota bacterium]
MKTCPRCDSKKFWSLSSGQIHCSKCGLTIKTSKNIWSKTRISPYWKGRLVNYFLFGVPPYRLIFQISGKIEMYETMFGSRRPGKYSWGTTSKA